MISRFYIHAEVTMGDADGPYNMDLFVDAPDFKAALRVWRAYYAEELEDFGKPDDKPKVYQLPPLAGAGALVWDKLPMKELAA